MAIYAAILRAANAKNRHVESSKRTPTNTGIDIRDVGSIRQVDCRESAIYV